MPDKVTLRLGQAIAWPKSPSGIAQVAELRRRRVRIVYVCKNGRIRQPVVRVADVIRERLLFDLQNPFNRGVLPREKTFVIATQNPPPAYRVPPPRGVKD